MPSFEGSNGDVDDGARRNGAFEGIKLLGNVVHVKIYWEPFGGPFCNT